MSTLEYNGVKIFADDSEILLEKSLDGGFHHFHVCCGCHKVHEVTMRVKGEGQLLSSHWLLPHPKESAKIISELQSVTPDLIQYELANERAADEIASLRAKLDAVCEAGATLASEVLDICEDPFCDGPRCLACVAMKAAIAAAREGEK